MRLINFFLLLLVFYSGIVSAKTAIDTSMGINIGGIKQWINISGKDTSKLLLLFLSGGPGNSNMNNNDFFTKKLQDKFMVVFWDQRELGKYFN